MLLGYTDPEWGLKEAIRKQVAREDQVAWAQGEEPEFAPPPPLSSTKWNPTAKYVFGRGIIRFAHSLMP